jgi:hypothetical protein
MECFRIANGLNYERLHFDGNMVRPWAIIRKQVMTMEPISQYCPESHRIFLCYWSATTLRWFEMEECALNVQAAE